VRSLLLRLHRWVGLIAAVFLVILGVTGSALVFENEIDRALNPTLFRVTPAGAPLLVGDLVARAQVLRPTDRVLGVRLPEAADQAYEFALRSGQSMTVDQYTGRILGVRDREKSLARVLHVLHTRLVSVPFGERLVGWASVLLLLLAVSGVVLWWPRRILTLRRSSSQRRLTFDLHNVVGFYSSIVLVAIAASAVMIAFERTLDPLVRMLNPAGEAPAAESTPQTGPLVGLDAALDIARQTLPGAFASNVNVPASPKAVFRVLMKFPEDRTPAGRSRVIIDQFSGRVLQVENTRTAPFGTRILNLKRSVHTGDIFGAPTRALYFLVSLGLALQAATGVLIWWK
jgi:uncharacterized iron-regulated membrane protein